MAVVVEEEAAIAGLRTATMERSRLTAPMGCACYAHTGVCPCVCGGAARNPSARNGARPDGLREGGWTDGMDLDRMFWTARGRWRWAHLVGHHTKESGQRRRDDDDERQHRRERHATADFVPPRPSDVARRRRRRRVGRAPCIGGSDGLIALRGRDRRQDGHSNESQQ